MANSHGGAHDGRAGCYIVISMHVVLDREMGREGGHAMAPCLLLWSKSSDLSR